MSRNNSRVGDVGKGVLGVGVGFALYMLISGFGGGAGFGWGRGRGEGRGEQGAGSTAPPVGPGPAGPARSQLKLTPTGITVDGKPMSLDEAVAAVKAARDVDVVVTGDTIQGDVDDLLVALFLAGITWRGADDLVRSAPRSMDDVRRVREQKRRAKEWEKLSEAEKEKLREAAIEEAKRNAPPTDEELRKIVERSRAPKVSGNARGHYGRGRRG